MGFLKNLYRDLTGENQRDALSGASGLSRGALQDGFDDAIGYLQPYGDTGAFDRLNAGLAPGGEFSGTYQGDFDPAAFGFDPNLPDAPDAYYNQQLPGAGFDAPVDPFSGASFDLAGDRGFQHRLQTGLDALDNRAAAQGKALSGQQDKALLEFSQNLAADEYDRAYNRALAENELAYGRALGENTLGYDRGLALDAAGRQGFGENFDRGITLGDQLFNQGLTGNELAYGRALGADERGYDRFGQDQDLAYTRLRDLAGIDLNTANTLAGMRSTLGQNLSGIHSTIGQAQAQPFTLDSILRTADTVSRFLPGG